MATVQKMHFVVGSHSYTYYDNFHNRLSADFQNSVLLQTVVLIMVFNETKNYDFILPSKTCQPHLETRTANVWDLVQSHQSPFQKTVLVFDFLFFHGKRS